MTQGGSKEEVRMNISKAVGSVTFIVIIAVIFIAVSHRGSRSGSNTISVDEVKNRLDNKDDIFILDVRSQGEYSEGHIKGATLIPMNQVKKNLDKIPKDKDVVVLCAVGGRSSAATKFLVKAGYTNVYNMPGGMVKWQKKGYPVEK